MQTFAWQGFELKHPSDWECVRFSKNRSRGECALADPSGRRMSVCWSAVRGTVDAKKILHEAALQLGKSDPKGKLSESDWKGPGRWSGFRWTGSECLTVALSYFSDAGYLLQAQFFSNRKPDETLERRVLDSIRYQDDGELWQWRAFGCRLTLPRQFEIDGCDIFPGRATLKFKIPGRSGQKLRVDRLAIPESHLNGRPFKQWLATTLDDSRRLINSRDGAVRGHTCLHAELKPGRRTPMQFLTGKRRESKATVWICENEARLYRTEWEGIAGAAPDLGHLVECCQHA